MLGIIKNQYNKFNYYIRNLAPHKQPLCRLEEIDVIKRKIIIYCRGTATAIKINLEEIIYDDVSISNLSSMQAAWIGYYYGIFYKKFKLLNHNRMSELHDFGHLSISDIGCDCSMTMLDRNGNLFYFDNVNNASYVSTPLMILKSKGLINKFQSIQACYIGILAGLSISKDKPIDSDSYKPKLMIIKKQCV